MDEPGAARLASAAEAALTRLRSTSFADPFPALGEALFWIVALAEARGRADVPLVLGLKWARNRIAHGVLPAAPVRVDHGAQLAFFRLGHTRLGSGPRVVWQARAAVRLGPGYRERYPDQAAAYDELVAGRGVGQPLRDALDTLR